MVYGYDANGNITSANNRTFVCDLSNRLIRVEENSSTLGEYVYNALNQRIKKTVQGQTTIFHYDLRGHLIAETNESGITLAEYFYLGSQPLAMIRPGEILYYYHNDHLGTPQILTDETGTVSWKAVYGPFGEAEISVETVENPFRFPGQNYDQETGLHYNRNRYYDPKTGRYLTPDPIGLKGGINLFPYAENTPIRFIDPVGLQSGIFQCDGNGNYEIVINNKGCDAGCTAEHENVHRENYLRRFGPEGCKGIRKGGLPGPALDEWDRQDECDAYQAGKACREKLLKNAKDPCCKDDIERGIERDNRALRENNCNMWWRGFL